MITNCPHCGSDRIHKNGGSPTRPRGICRSCQRTFAAEVAPKKRGRKPGFSIKKVEPQQKTKPIKAVDPDKTEYLCQQMLKSWEQKQQKWSNPDRRPVRSAQEAYGKGVA